MSRTAASEAKKKLKRKVKRILESSSSDDEEEQITEWNLRPDSKCPLKFAITPETAAKWKEAESRVRVRKEKKQPIVPIVITKDLAQEQLLEIGETLVEEIDTNAAWLKTNFDTEAIDFDHITRAPGVTDAQIKKFTEDAQKYKKEGIEVECMIPLLWFSEVLLELPFLTEVKKMYFNEAKQLALNTSAHSFREVWKHVIITYSERKQDIADYLWHAQNSVMKDSAEDSNKQQRVE